jgi:hypothetical protein
VRAHRLRPSLAAKRVSLQGLGQAVTLSIGTVRHRRESLLLDNHSRLHTQGTDNSTWRALIKTDPVLWMPPAGQAITAARLLLTVIAVRRAALLCTEPLAIVR